ncbi:iron-sulfur cluster insertion protein ErpA [Deinococcus carri]|uniref:Iron-sulfur cluster insertion protein ErpA n=1 Tax=Deinococcus carri TaxID=1211323 RepID=A0ABP9WBB1_9DEIO
MKPPQLTPAALAQIRTLGSVLRVSLEPGGGCGTAYAFALAAQPGDLTHDLGSVTLALSPEVARVLTGARLDYGARLKPPRFRVLAHPNTPHRCACNRSFGVPFPGRVTPECRAYQPMLWNLPECP